MKTNGKTGIMATAGPTMQDISRLTKAVEAGVTSFRINMGLRTRDLLGYFRNIRAAEKLVAQPVKVLLDMPSSRPRIGQMSPFKPQAGDILYLADIDQTSGAKTNLIPLPGLSAIILSVKPGDRVLFRDGQVVFVVKDRVDERTLQVECVTAAADLRPSGSGVFPDSDVFFQPLAADDVALWEKFVANDLVPDYVTVSFTSIGSQIADMRKAVRDHWGDNKDIKIIAKIETRAGLRNFEQIAGVSDGIMVARGDLLLHIPAYTLPKIQEHLVRKTNAAGKISIVATQMFEHFAVSGVVNRAELSDVALAVRQSADAVMLSMETGNSNYPLETVELVRRVIEQEYSGGDIFSQFPG